MLKQQQELFPPDKTELEMVSDGGNGYRGSARHHNRYKYYVAGSWLRRDELRRRAMDITKRGGSVTSSWLDKKVDPDYVTQKDRSYGQFPWMDELDRQAALTDLADVTRSSFLVLQTEAPGFYTTGGRLIEFGYALAKKLTVCIIGRRENVFHYLTPEDRVEFFATWEEFYNFVEAKAQFLRDYNEGKLNHATVRLDEIFNQQYRGKGSQPVIVLGDDDDLDEPLGVCQANRGNGEICESCQ